MSFKDGVTKSLFLVLLALLLSACREDSQPVINEYIPVIERNEFQIIKPQAGDIWYLNQTYEIKWLPSSRAKYVIIELYRKNTRKGIISPKTENNGSFMFTVPTEMASSNLYRIKIINYNDTLETIISNYFSIRP